MRALAGIGFAVIIVLVASCPPRLLPSKSAVVYEHDILTIDPFGPPSPPPASRARTRRHPASASPPASLPCPELDTDFSSRDGLTQRAAHAACRLAHKKRIDVSLPPE